MAGRTMTVAIRPMAVADLAVVAPMERAIYPQPWSEQVFRDELARPDRRYFVAEENGDVVGYGGLMLVGEDAHITTIAVLPGLRSRGVGTRLMLQLVDAALAAGTRHLTLEVRISNYPARELYQRFGLAPVGLRKNYYANEDALIMWAIDIDEPEYHERLEEIRAGVLSETPSAPEVESPAAEPEAPGESGPPQVRRPRGVLSETPSGPEVESPAAGGTVPAAEPEAPGGGVPPQVRRPI